MFDEFSDDSGQLIEVQYDKFVKKIVKKAHIKEKVLKFKFNKMTNEDGFND